MRRILFAVALIFALIASAHNAREWKKSTGGDLNFIIANDLGRNGYYLQKPIAELMGEVADNIGPEAVLDLGDTHHFDGVQSVADPLWLTNFELIYSHPELMIAWYSICGNHEYRGNTQAVLDYSTVSRRWNMPARYYAKTFVDSDVSVKVIFLDTTPLIEKYRVDSVKYPDASKQDVAAQLTWLDATLAEATEDWIVVVGHHPIFADTSKSESEQLDMQRAVDSILCKYDVGMYICGHIHNFQHIVKPGRTIDYVVNSSASLSRTKVKSIEGTVFTSGKAGFSILSASSDELKLSMIDDTGAVIHQVIRRHH